MACLAIVQQEQGCQSAESEKAVAAYLGMPPIAVHEVTTFYNMYNQQPVGKYKLNVCTNLPCQLRDGAEALEHLEQAGHRRARPQPTACSPAAERVPGRLRRFAGDAGQRPPDVQLHEQRQARRADRRRCKAKAGSRHERRMLDLSQFQATGVETCFHGRHINPQIYAGLTAATGA